ncbi:hypothetical protein LCGC14_0893660, partial [marine sediment metagenome]
TLVLLVICIYDFINNIYLFRYYKEVIKYNETTN